MRVVPDSYSSSPKTQGHISTGTHSPSKSSTMPSGHAHPGTHCSTHTSMARFCDPHVLPHVVAHSLNTFSSGQSISRFR